MWALLFKDFLNASAYFRKCELLLYGRTSKRSDVDLFILVPI